jgi:aspartate kinase
MVKPVEGAEAEDAPTAHPRICVGGIMQWRNLVRLGVMNTPDKPGIAADIFSTLGQRGINVLLIVQSTDLRLQTHIVFCVHASDLAQARSVLCELKPRLQAEAIIEEPGLAIVSIHGPDFRERAGIAGAMFGALAAADINILAISTSISTCSCLIHQEKLACAVASLQAAFILP